MAKVLIGLGILMLIIGLIWHFFPPRLVGLVECQVMSITAQTVVALAFIFPSSP